MLETCALSNLPILPGDPAKLVFLSSNPYRIDPRGGSIRDHWILRTPALNVIYDEFGRVEVEDNYLQRIVADVFAQDVVERPFGQNKKTQPAVLRTSNFQEFLHASREGCLKVYDHFRFRKDNRIEDGIPTWKRVHYVLQRAGFTIMQDATDYHGYNARAIRYGVVVVESGDPDAGSSQLMQVMNALRRFYTVNLFFEDSKQRSNPCLMVTPKKTSISNISQLMTQHAQEVRITIQNHPNTLNRHNFWVRKLDVLPVLIKSQVWQKYVELGKDSYKEVTKAWNDANKNGLSTFPLKLFGVSEMQICYPHHMNAAALQETLSADNFDDLMQNIKECFAVENVMDKIAKSWSVPSMQGANIDWKLRQQIQSHTAQTMQQMHKEEIEAAKEIQKQEKKMVAKKKATIRVNNS